MTRRAVAIAAAVALCVACKGRNLPPSSRGGINRAPTIPQPTTIVVTPRALRSYEMSGYLPLPKAYTRNHELPPAPWVDLGRTLFYDPRLSKNQDIACDHCHDLSDYGMDGQAKSDGHKGQLGKRNAPSVFNAAGHGMQFWDGREPTVEDQAKDPVLNPLEMAMPNEQAIVTVLRSIPDYVKDFKTAFPSDAEPITIPNFGKAVGAFERGLVTPSRWDKFVSGDNSALSPEEQFGFLTFSEVGCPTCHSGQLVGGNIFEKLGRSKPWPNQKDKGRQDVTNNISGNMVFKVASLRNVEKTGPYFHDASSTKLEDAVHRMAEYQLGVLLKPDQVAAIVTWLKTLTGQIDQEYIKEPALPKSSDSTPKPDPS
ncbi:MAG TPA: cytochrome c peroxidase [Polyangiaceae bacterium]|nr:cytochrome c peroxidase [Polyangiaceae bacterium]